MGGFDSVYDVIYTTPSGNEIIATCITGWWSGVHWISDGAPGFQVRNISSKDEVDYVAEKRAASTESISCMECGAQIAENHPRCVQCG
jgi:hypothetical protein